MPQQTGKSALAARLGARGAKAHAEARDKPPEFDSGGRLPAGIENGVAQLVECKFDVIKPGKTNAGEYFFYAAGVVVSPTSFVDKDNVKHDVEGRRTAIMEVMCDTPDRSRKTIEEHYHWVLNEFKKLGVDTSTTTVNDLEAIAASLKQSKPYFKFRTWKGAPATEGKYKGKEPMVNEVWQGVTEYSPVGSNGVAADHTGSASQPDDVQYQDDQDLDSLLAAADDANNPGCDAAQARLKEIALAGGMTEEDYDSVQSFEELGELLKNPTKADAGEAKDDKPWEPKKEECYFYKPVDAKTKKPAKKGVECEVVSVDKKAKTVKLRRLDTKKEVDKVSWDDLSGEA